MIQLVLGRWIAPSWSSMGSRAAYIGIASVGSRAASVGISSVGFRAASVGIVSVGFRAASVGIASVEYSNSYVVFADELEEPMGSPAVHTHDPGVNVVTDSVLDLQQ